VSEIIEIEPVATLEPVRQEWTELATRSRSVFKTWEWLSTWWDHFGEHRALMVVAVQSQDRLVGILPLYRWRHVPCGPCGSSTTPLVTSSARSALPPTGR
jgi:hypothetical protein